MEQERKLQEEAKIGQVLHYIAAIREQERVYAANVQSTQSSRFGEYSESSDLQSRFLSGYRAAFGSPRYEQHILQVVGCESSWRIEPDNPDYLGLSQATPSTWASYARFGAETDYLDPWEQGWFAANLIGDLEERGISPGSANGWPVCWWS